MGTVMEARPKRRMGRGGKLRVTVDYAVLTTGEKVALRAAKEAAGDGRVGTMVVGMAFSSVLSPLFLLMRGDDITIPKGTQITAYVNGTAFLGPAKAGSTAGVAPSGSPAE
jgi:hypothetical protein